MKTVILSGFLCCSIWAQPEPLWPNGAPGAIGKEDLDQPALTPYLASSPNGTTVIVCPGGGYRQLAIDKEGVQIAQWLNSLGVSAFVLKYRLGPRYHHPAMLQDAQRAIRTVRFAGHTVGSYRDLGILGGWTLGLDRGHALRFRRSRVGRSDRTREFAARLYDPCLPSDFSEQRVRAYGVTHQSSG